MNFDAMKNKQDTPKVGVGVLITKDDNILLMKRQGSHGAGTWCLPGGHVDLGEDLVTTCKREVLEEVGITIDTAIPVTFKNVILEDEGLHYVTLFHIALWDKVQTPKIMEPKKCSELKWHKFDEFPRNLFPGLHTFITSDEGVGFSYADEESPQDA